MRDQATHASSSSETSSSEGSETTTEAHGAGSAKFTNRGTIPPVAHGGGPPEQPSASDRAFNDIKLNSDVVGSAVKAALVDDNAGLGAAGLKQKFDKLKKSPFVFFRGTAALFYRDLKGMDKAMAEVTADGDVHPENFGVTEGKDGTLFFGLNDFDESSKAPFTFDLRRGVTAFELAAREKGISDENRALIVHAFLHGYSHAIASYIGDNKENAPAITTDNAKHHSKIVADLLDKSAGKHRDKFLSDRVDEKARKFKTTDEIQPCSSRLGEFQKALASYAPAHGFSSSDILDVAAKLDSGTASLGSDRYYILVANPKGPEHDRVLEVKEENPSVMEAAGVKREGRSPAERVAGAQQIESPDGDPYYGAASLKGKSFLLRERNPHKVGLDLANTVIGSHDPAEKEKSEDGKDKPQYSVQDFIDYAETCGEALGQSHARSGKQNGESAEKTIDKTLDANLKAEIEQFAITEADRVTAQWKAFAAAK